MALLLLGAIDSGRLAAGALATRGLALSTGHCLSSARGEVLDGAVDAVDDRRWMAHGGVFDATTKLAMERGMCECCGVSVLSLAARVKHWEVVD